MSSQVGTLLSGRYRLDAQIGAGGMSTVYRAFDTVLERQVAIKLMHREIAADSDQLERFRREARAVAQLNHPHIVGVIDAARRPPEERPASASRPTPYIVFEYVEGETLKDRIRRMGRLPIPEAVAYAIEIARALGAAHDRAHRPPRRQAPERPDRRGGHGARSPTSASRARSTEEGLTADGRVLGTTDYVSPEQALGHDVGPQSDLYSLGIVLYEMLTGDVPFHGENQVAVAMKHVREELPDVQMRRPEVSSALAAVVDRATAKDLDQRYQRRRRADRRPRGRARRSRPRAPARRPARRPRSCARCPAGTRRRAAAARVAAPGARSSPCSRSPAAIAAVVLVVAPPTSTRARHRAAATSSRRPGLQVGLARPEPRAGLRPVRRRRRAPGRGQGASSTSDPNSTWSTESYDGGVISTSPASASTSTPSRASPRSAIDIQHADAGLAGRDLRRAERPAADARSTRLDEARADRADAKTPHARRRSTPAGKRFRYYLVWITKLPPERREGRDLRDPLSASTR